MFFELDCRFDGCLPSCASVFVRVFSELRIADAGDATCIHADLGSASFHLQYPAEEVCLRVDLGPNGPRQHHRRHRKVPQEARHGHPHHRPIATGYYAVVEPGMYDGIAVIPPNGSLSAAVARAAAAFFGASSDRGFSKALTSTAGAAFASISSHSSAWETVAKLVDAALFSGVASSVSHVAPFCGDDVRAAPVEINTVFSSRIVGSIDRGCQGALERNPQEYRGNVRSAVLQ